MTEPAIDIPDFTEYDEDFGLVPLDGTVACHLRCLVARDIQAFYDDPQHDDPNSDDGIVTMGTSIRMQYWQLRKTCHQLKIDWDEIVQEEATSHEVERMNELLESK